MAQDTILVVTWDGSQMQLTFAQASASSLASYDYQRLPDGLTVSVAAPAGAAGSLVSVYANAVAGEAYAYRIRAVDSRGVAGPWSNYDLATAMTFSDAPVTGGVTPIRGVHIAEMRRAIDAIRRMSGLPAFWSSYANATGPILASQMIELRTVLDDARSLVGFAGVTYTRPITVPYPRVSNADMNELRGGVR